jgi:DoxX-like family
MEMTVPAVPVSKGKLWTGRSISALVVLFLLFDGVTKVMKDPRIIAASLPLGFSADMIAAIGAILLACVVLYVIPRTANFGALLLTGYLGGAVVTNMRAGMPVLMCLFPVIFGVLVWAGLYVRNPRLRVLLP